MVSGAPWSPEEVAQLTELLAAGHSRGECVRIMGRPLGGVRGTMLRHRLTSTARGGDPATLARRANSDRECLFVHSDSYSEPYAAYGRMDDAERNSAANSAPRAASSSGPGLYSGGPGASPGRGSVPPPDDVRRLVDLCRARPRSLRDVCDALNCSPRAAEELLEHARSAGYTVDVAGDAVAWRRPDAELRIAAATATIKPCTGSRFKLGVCSDLHFGSKYTMREQLEEYARSAYAQGVRVFVVAGDLLDGCYKHGMWELSHHGWDEQARDAFESLPRLDGAVWYVIDGNHDATFWDQTGAVSGERLQDYFASRGRSDLIYLGHREGNLTIRMAGVQRPIAVQLWHPRPGKSYALSYQLQKRVEAYAPGTKPDVLVAGHWHTCVYLESRGIHALAAGCFQSPESAFARSLAGGVSMGGWVLSWECTPSGTMRRVAAERSAYYVREESRAIDLERSA